jgi:hypothetical protein
MSISGRAGDRARPGHLRTPSTGSAAAVDSSSAAVVESSVSFDGRAEALQYAAPPSLIAATASGVPAQLAPQTARLEDSLVPVSSTSHPVKERASNGESISAGTQAETVAPPTPPSQSERPPSFDLIALGSTSRLSVQPDTGTLHTTKNLLDRDPHAPLSPSEPAADPDSARLTALPAVPTQRLVSLSTSTTDSSPSPAIGTLRAIEENASVSVFSERPGTSPAASARDTMRVMPTNQSTSSMASSALGSKRASSSQLGSDSQHMDESSRSSQGEQKVKRDVENTPPAATPAQPTPGFDTSTLPMAAVRLARLESQASDQSPSHAPTQSSPLVGPDVIGMPVPRLLAELKSVR